MSIRSVFSIIRRLQFIRNTEHAVSKPVEALNTYLVFRDLSPSRSQITVPWETAGERTKRYYIRKVGQGVTAVVQDIAP